MFIQYALVLISDGSNDDFSCLCRSIMVILTPSMALMAPWPMPSPPVLTLEEMLILTMTSPSASAQPEVRPSITTICGT